MAWLGRMKFWRLRLLAFSLAAVLAVYFFGRLDAAILSWRIKTVPARFGEVETRLAGTGVILREEVVVAAPATGRLTLLVSDGRTVRPGDVLGEVDVRAELASGAASQVAPVASSGGPSGASPGGPSGAPGSSAQSAGTAGSLTAVGPLSEADYVRERELLVRNRSDLEARVRDAEKVMRDALAVGDSEIVQEAQQRRDRFRSELAHAEAAIVELDRRWAERSRHPAPTAASASASAPSISGGAPASAVFRAAAAGLFLTTLDGFDGAYAPGHPVEEAPWDGRLVARRSEDGRRVEAGDPVARIVRTDRFEMVVRLRDAPIERGMRVDITLGSGAGVRLPARVSEVQRAGEHTFVRLSVDAYDEVLAGVRRSDVVMSARSAQGIVVPSSALTERNGKQGVYILLGDRPIFREVRVLGGDEREAVVDGVIGVPVGAPVVVNPKLVK